MHIITYLNSRRIRVCAPRTFNTQEEALEKAALLVKRHANSNRNTYDHYEDVVISEVLTGKQLSLPPPPPPDIIQTLVNL